MTTNSSGDDRQAQPMPSDMSARELGRWAWRQLTSMRTALVLLLLLALAAIPGSIIPQTDVDALGTSRWKDAHPKLTPIYDNLGLFSVYDSPWFSAIYLLLMVSLVGCILPRTAVYWRALRAKPPKAPRNLARLPESAAYETDDSPDEVLERAAAELKRRRYRVLVADDSVSAEKGYTREAGNLLFHLSVLIVLVGFAALRVLPKPTLGFYGATRRLEEARPAVSRWERRSPWRSAVSWPAHSPQDCLPDERIEP